MSPSELIQQLRIHQTTAEEFLRIADDPGRSVGDIRDCIARAHVHAQLATSYAIEVAAFE